MIIIYLADHTPKASLEDTKKEHLPIEHNLLKEEGKKEDDTPISGKGINGELSKNKKDPLHKEDNLVKLEAPQNKTDSKAKESHK